MLGRLDVVESIAIADIEQYAGTIHGPQMAEIRRKIRDLPESIESLRENG